MAEPSSVPKIRTDLAYYGVVTRVISATQFVANGLAGMGDGALVGYAAYVLAKLNGTITPPHAEQPAVTAYVSSSGTITHVAYTAPLAAGDQLLLLHPNISTLMASGQAVPAINSVNNITSRDVVGNKADTAQQTPVLTASLVRYIKGLITALGNPTGDIEATITAKWGDIARSLDLILGARWDGAGDLGTDIAAIIAAVAATSVGSLQIAATTIDLQQIAGTYTLFTGTAQHVVVEKFLIRLPNVNVSDDVNITSISIQTNDTTPMIFITNAQGAKVNLTAEQQLSWTGAIMIDVGKLIRLTIAGGAADAPTPCDVICEYRTVVAGGTLA